MHRRYAALLAAGLGAVAAAFWFRPGPDPAPSSGTVVAAAPPPASHAAPGLAATVPSFDVVRVSPDGSAVIAGRASPGAQVVVRSGKQEIGRALADDRGEWVLVPDNPLPPGAHEITLAARDPGGAERSGEGSVVLAVPAPPQAVAAGPGQPSQPNPAPPAALALLIPPSGMPRVLQGPAPTPGRLALGTVDYDDHGAIRFGGTAPANAPIRIYVDNRPVGDARTDSSGAWTLTPRNAVALGQHRVRVDLLDAAGRVRARVVLPFQRVVLPASALAGGERVVVQPGQSLWRIARLAYGQGLRYTVIYAANHDQIRDPDRIFPGQVFATPQP